MSVVSKSDVVTSTARPVRSRSRSAATMPRAAHIPVPMSTIEGEAPLVAVEGEKRRRLIAPPRRRPRARVVAAPGPLDLDHVGPHVAEHLRAERTGDVLREVGDDDAFERERHAESLPPWSVPDFSWHQRSKFSH